MSRPTWRRTLAALLVAGATILAVPSAAQAAPPTYQPRLLPASAGSFTPSRQGLGNPFSPDGRLVAGSVTVGDTTRAAVYDTTSRSLRPVGRVLGGTASAAVDVNDRGDVVATVARAGATTTVYLAQGSTRPVSLGSDVQAHGMNNYGVVVGEASFRAFRWTRTTGVRLLPAASATSLLPTRAYSVNAAGTIVGETDQQGIVYDPGTQRTTELPVTPGQLYTTAYDINDRGIVVGILQAGPDDTRAFAFSVSTGTFTPLSAGGQAGYARTISKRGTIAGVLVDRHQAAVWRDCGTAFTALGPVGGPGAITPYVYGTDASGATWSEDGQGRIVRWVRTPGCS